jgi:glycosyltransferase involved in cell wall biosynthesis
MIVYVKKDNMNSTLLKPLKIVSLTGGVNSASSYFRIRQYIKPLAQSNITVEEYIPYFHDNCGLPSIFKALSHLPGVIASRNADVVWIRKVLVQGYETFERCLKKPRVLDVDDAVWLNYPFGRYAVPHIAKAMDAIIAGNTYLADYFSKYCRNIYIVPTAIDLSRYIKRPSVAIPNNKFVIGWTGFACNYKYLSLIEQPLKQFLIDHTNAELLLIAEKPWESSEIPVEKIRYIKWSREIEATVLQQMSVGIMPLTDDPWSRGKCSFKMLQYMSVGLPVIVSPVGMNRDILSKANVGFAATSADQWYESLQALYNNQDLQFELGNNGRRVVENDFSATAIATQLATIFRILSNK